MKAKLGNKEDREYYQRYCKDGVDFAKLVSIQIIWSLFFVHVKSNAVKHALGYDKKKGTLKAVFHGSESSRAPEGWLVSCHADAQ